MLPLAAASVFAMAAFSDSARAAVAAPAESSAPALSLPAPSLSSGSNASVPSGAAILQELREFRTFGTVLMVAAHPDDENRPLLAFLSKSLDLRTGYLSINRGDGRQNEIGPEFGERLGVIRTQELLAGRRLDGARQFFTRAIDFGYSKSMEETLRIWDHQAVLGDVVRVIRTFRPDVITTVFAPVAQPGNHGHHNASAFLAREAFKLTGDPKAYPEQIAEGLQPWQPVRIVQGGGNGLSISGGGTDPATGETIQAIASRTSAQHKTQGVGGGRGGGGGNNFSAGFTLLDGAPGTGLLDGVDTTWARITNGGAEIAKLADDLIAQFKPDTPDASVPAILALRAKLAALKSDDTVVAEKRVLFDRILQRSLGLVVETTTPNAEVVAGEQMIMHYSAMLQSSEKVIFDEPPSFFMDNKGAYTGLTRAGSSFAAPLAKGQAVSREMSQGAAAGGRITQPYWLREEPAAGTYRVSPEDAGLVGLPENPGQFFANYFFSVGGQSLVIRDEVRVAGETGPLGRRVAVVSPVTLKFASGVALFTPGAKKTIEVEVSAARANAAGTLRLELPAGWTATPAGQPFKLAAGGDKAKLAFTITAPASAATGSILAVAEMSDGTRYSNGRVDLRYDHIPTQILQPPARLRVTATDFAIRGKTVGYLSGAGDDTAESLAQLGYAVTVLTGTDLTPEKLRGLDAVVIGVRAFNERTDFTANIPALLAYAEAGGTVIAQYNRPNGLRTQQLGPYPLSIQGQAPPLRVTDENAPVTFLLPDHPALNVPNKITPADFAGWVQERGAYFASQWDEQHYEAPLAMSDPRETQPNSSLLIAKHGKGYYVYTSLAFFRQLPAGVPGAYRLFANLVSLGK
ncbi:MAG: PIG-L family deacetylase [Verrucomicrobiota bacterium]